MHNKLAEMGLAPKEQGLANGTFAFIGIWVLAALTIGQYAHYTSKDRHLANHNRL